jgi:hypothetical protein
MEPFRANLGRLCSFQGVSAQGTRVIPIARRAPTLGRRAPTLGRRVPPFERRAPTLGRRVPPLMRRAPMLGGRSNTQPPTRREKRRCDGFEPPNIGRPPVARALTARRARVERPASSRRLPGKLATNSHKPPVAGPPTPIRTPADRRPNLGLSWEILGKIRAHGWATLDEEWCDLFKKTIHARVNHVS